MLRSADRVPGIPGSMHLAYERDHRQPPSWQWGRRRNRWPGVDQEGTVTSLKDGQKVAESLPAPWGCQRSSRQL